MGDVKIKFMIKINCKYIKQIIDFSVIIHKKDGFMKKILICLLVLLNLNVCFASENTSINKAYKDINSLCKSQDVDGLSSYVKTNKYARKAISQNGEKLVNMCIKKDYDSKIVKILLKNGVDINLFKENPIIEAIKNDDVELVEAILSGNYDINKCFKGNRTALIFAADYNGNPKVIKMLLDKGADINIPDSCGSIPLLTICRREPNSAGIYLLIDAGSDLYRFNRSDQTPYSVLPTGRKKEVQNYYNKSMSKRLSQRFVDKNKSLVIAEFGIPDKKITIDNNTEGWEYETIEQHYVTMTSTTNSYSTCNSSSRYNTTYRGGYTIKIKKKMIFTITKNCVSSAKFTSSYNTSR